MPNAGMPSAILGPIPTVFKPGSGEWIQSVVVGNTAAALMQPSQTREQKPPGKAADEIAADQDLSTPRTPSATIATESPFAPVALPNILSGDPVRGTAKRG